jgi:DNA polymerase III subunit gamma/tau
MHNVVRRSVGGGATNGSGIKKNPFYFATRLLQCWFAAMSYQVFARKYRPRTFDDVLGQDHVIRTLKNAIAQNRTAHAYLLVGPRGTGKTSTARILAKALNCTGGPRVDFDPDEPICQEIAEGRCLDVIEIDGASNRGIDHIRDLRDSVPYAPMHGRFRIYYIDEVHMLTPESFNALLKTLEEPPPHVKFIFATTEPNKILPTIISRCQRFDLRRIPDEIIAEQLLRIGKAEGVTIDPVAARSIARGAEGGMRDAQSMLDQLVAFCGNVITEDDVLNIFGFTSHETIAQLSGAILKKETAAALERLHEQSDRGKDLTKLLADLILHFRNLLVHKMEPARAKDAAPEVARTLVEQADLISVDRLINLIDQFAEVDSRMKWAPNKRLYFEIGLIKAIRSLEEVSLGDVIVTLRKAGALGGGSESSSPGSASAPATVPTSAQSSDGLTESVCAAVTATERGRLAGVDLWRGLLTELQARLPLQAGFAMSGVFLEESDCELVIGVAPASAANDALAREPARRVVEEILSSLAGRPMTLRLETRGDIAPPPKSLPPAPVPSETKATIASTDTPAAPPVPPGDSAQAVSAEQFYNDPLISEALRLFEARITSITPAKRGAAPAGA